MKKWILKHKKIALFLLIALIVFFSPFRTQFSIEEAGDFIRSIQGNPSAPLIYIMIYIGGVVLALPGIALTLLAAPIFGFWQGLLLVIIGSNIGCQLTFWISRWLGGDLIQKIIRADTFLEKASKQIEKNGLIFMLYVRLIPLFPFNGINYLSGLTKIRYRDYAIGSLVGMLPGTTVYVYLSHTATDIQNNPLGIIVSVGVLLGFTLIISVVKRKSNLS